MVIIVKCPHCGNKWKYKGNAIKATCTSCYRKVQVRSMPDPGPRKTPAAVRKLLAKKTQPEPVGPALSLAIERSQTADGQVLRGQLKEKTTGRKIQTETIVAPSPVLRHTLQPLDPADAQGVECQLCHKPLSKKPRANVILDSQKAHALCVLDKAITEASGDLGAAAQAYEGITLEVLQKRAQRLIQAGKLNQEGVLA